MHNATVGSDRGGGSYARGNPVVQLAWAPRRSDQCRERTIRIMFLHKSKEETILGTASKDHKICPQGFRSNGRLKDGPAS